jgi:aminopeptidase N
LEREPCQQCFLGTFLYVINDSLRIQTNNVVGLNEGWTTYLERRIQAEIHGEAHRDFSAIIGWRALEDSIELFGEDHEFTKLVVDLKGKDPDDAFSSVPYEKGFNFLYRLEKLIGKDKWDKFIPHVSSLSFLPCLSN